MVASLSVLYRCKELNAKACENVVCKDNPHFYCKLDKKYNCNCPSCDDVDYWQRGIKTSSMIRVSVI